MITAITVNDNSDMQRELNDTRTFQVLLMFPECECLNCSSVQKIHMTGVGAN